MNMLLLRLFISMICAEMICRLGELMPPDMNPNNASVCCYSQSYPTDLSKLILMERPTSASMTHSQLRESLQQPGHPGDRMTPTGAVKWPPQGAAGNILCTCQQNVYQNTSIQQSNLFLSTVVAVQCFWMYLEIKKSLM